MDKYSTPIYKLAAASKSLITLRPEHAFLCQYIKIVLGGPDGKVVNANVWVLSIRIENEEQLAMTGDKAPPAAIFDGTGYLSFARCPPDGRFELELENREESGELAVFVTIEGQRQGARPECGNDGPEFSSTDHAKTPKN